MNIDRRSGAPSTFTWFLGLTLGATCAAMTPACSASSGASPGGWGQSGGGPLGADQSSSGGGGDDASAPSHPGPGSGDAASPLPSSDAGVSDDATTGGGDGASLADAAGDGPVEGSVVGPNFTLIDTTITTVIDGSPVPGFDPLAPDVTFNLFHVGSALSIRANTVPALVGSVAFALDATYTHTENTAPYMLCSDNGAGVVTSCAAILTVGAHTLTATPYSAASLAGDAGAPFSLSFTIVDIDAGTGEGGAADSGVKDAAGQ